MHKLRTDEDGTVYLEHSHFFQRFVDHCTVYCHFNCCGYNSCDFSPLQIVSFIRQIGYAEAAEAESINFDAVAARLSDSLTELKRDFGSRGGISDGYEPEFYGEHYPGETIDQLCYDISKNLTFALELIEANRKHETQGSLKYLDKDQSESTAKKNKS